MAERGTLTRLRVAGLSGRKPTRFHLAPDGGARAALAGALGLLDLPALDLAGEIRPEGRGDFTLEARLRAHAVQPCSVTLAPVPARVDVPVLRRYIADWQDPEAEESEIPEDESLEPLPEVIDLVDLAAEALMLALPLFPRAPGAELGARSFAPPGAAPIEDEVIRPFDALKGLAEAMKPKKD